MGSRSNRDDAGFQIDSSRPQLKNKDGSVSTERTITVGFDDRYYNIPTIWEGKQVDNPTAIKRARGALAAGKEFPNFASLPEAERQAKARSAAIGRTLGANEMGSRSNYDDKVRSFPAAKQPVKRVAVPVKQKPDGSYEAAGKPRAAGPTLRKSGRMAVEEGAQEGAQQVSGATQNPMFYKKTVEKVFVPKERKLHPAKDGPTVTLKTDHYKLKSGKKWE